MKTAHVFRTFFPKLAQVADAEQLTTASFFAKSRHQLNNIALRPFGHILDEIQAHRHSEKKQKWLLTCRWRLVGSSLFGIVRE